MYLDVKYELHELEKLMTTGVSFVDEPGCFYHAGGRTDIIQKEIERIRQSLVQKVFIFENEGCLERYVQCHQQALIHLMDETFRVSKNSDFLSGHYSALEELLSFIERHFSKYLDQNAKAPESYIAVVKKMTEEELSSIDVKLNALNAGQRLMDIMVSPLRKFICSDSRSEHSYLTIRYTWKLQKELLKAADHADPQSCINERLRLVLCYLNYNSKKAFLQKFCRRESSQPENLFPEFKLKTDLSASQLACLVKVFMDSGVIQNKNTAEVIRFVAHFCETKRSGHISAGSLRGKFYEVESSTRESVSGILGRVMSMV